MAKPKSGVPGIRAMRGKWQWRFRMGRKDHCGITDFEATERNLSAAVMAMEEAKARVREGLPAPRRLSFTEAANRFVAWSKMEHRDKPNTWKRHRTSLSSMQEFFRGVLFAEITPGDMERYKTWRRENDIKEVTIRHDLHAASQLIQFALKDGWISRNPLDGVTIPSDQASRNEFVLAADDERAYLEQAALLQPALHDFAVLMLEQGLRPEEVLGLPKDAVDFDAGTLYVRSGKSRAARRTLYLTDASKVILGRRMASKSRWVFPGRKGGGHLTYSGMINFHNGVLAKTGLRFTPYSFRHTFATRLYEHTHDIASVARILGHADLKTVMRYVHIDDEQAQKAMRAFEAGKAKTTEVVQ